MCKKTIKNIVYVAIILSAVLSFLHGQEASVRRIIELEWGTEEYNIGIEFYPDSPAYGPAGFYIGEDKNIYIGDSKNGKIKKFDKNGRLIQSIDASFMYNGKRPVSFCHFTLDKEKDIIVLYKYSRSMTLKKFNKNGHELRKMDYDRNLIRGGSFKKVCVDSAMNIYLEGSRRIIKFDRGLNLLEEYRSQEEGTYIRFHNGKIFKEKYYYYLDQKNRKTLVRDRKNISKIVPTASLKNLAKVKTEPKEDFQFQKSLSNILIGEDQNENLYFLTKEQRGYPSVITKYDRNGVYTGKITPDFSGIHDSPASIMVSPDGDFYTDGSDENKYWIDCYPAEMFKK